MISRRKWFHLLSAFFGLAVAACASEPPPIAVDATPRTNGLIPYSRDIYPQAFFNRKPFHEFLPGESNWDPQHRHPDQWLGQDWDASMWNKNWTPEQTITYLYRARVFDSQTMDEDLKVPVLFLGPTFYKISDLDRRRAVKFLVDQSEIFNKGFSMVVLRDWYTKKTIGNYTANGLYLN